MIASIAMLVALTAYGCWISYWSGWMDSAQGDNRWHQGTPGDRWHIVRRRYILWPTLIAPSVLALVCALFSVQWWAALGIIPVGATSRLWFRLAVHHNGKYFAWYGRKFTVLGGVGVHE